MGFKMDSNLTAVSLRNVKELLLIMSNDKSANRMAKKINDIFTGVDYKVIDAEAKIRNDRSIAEFNITIQCRAEDGNDFLEVVYTKNKRAVMNFEFNDYGKASRVEVAELVKMAA